MKWIFTLLALYLGAGAIFALKRKKETETFTDAYLRDGFTWPVTLLQEYQTKDSTAAKTDAANGTTADTSQSGTANTPSTRQPETPAKQAERDAAKPTTMAPHA